MSKHTIMKQLLTFLAVLFCLTAFSQGNWPLTGSKNRWGNGFGFSSKSSDQLSAFTNASDSNLVQWSRVDSTLAIRGSIFGPWRKLVSFSDTIPETRFVRLQTGNLFRQDGKIWVSDTIRTSGLLRGSSQLIESDIQVGTGAQIATVLPYLFGATGTTKRTQLDTAGLRFYPSNLFEGFLTSASITGSNKTWTLPNATGTIALTSNVTDSSSALRASINTKLNISDTAAMLNNRLKISDTLTMLSPFIQFSDSGSYIRNQIGSNLVRQTAKLRISDTLRTDGEIYGGANLTLLNGSLRIGGSSTNIYTGTIPNALTGLYNSGFGTNAGQAVTSGNRNTAIGYGALFNNSSGSDNTALGYNAGAFVNGGGSAGSPTKGVYIGNGTNSGGSAQTNEIVIGDTTTGYGSNTMTLGNTNISTTRIRGNTIIPGTLTISGTFNSSVSTNADFPNIIANTSSGTGAFSTMYISNDGSGAGALAFGAVGTGNTTGGLFPQDGAVLYSGTNLSGGLSFGTRANAAAKIYTNATLAQTWNADQTTTLASLGTGTVYSNSGTLTNVNPSDQRIKNTISAHKYGLSEILKLQPKSFYYNSDTTKRSLKYGFIAQDVKAVMPDMVRPVQKGSDTLGLETDGIYVTMVRAIQEQQVIIDQIKKELNEAKATINQLKGIAGEARLRKTRR